VTGTRTYRLLGSGTVTLAAFGVGDAEARAEKELRAVFPDALVGIRGIRRLLDGDPVVDEFEVDYRLGVELEVGADPDEKRALRTAFAAARQRLAGTRFARIAWERGSPVD
jgi:hypothetical protein